MTSKTLKNTDRPTHASNTTTTCLLRSAGSRTATSCTSSTASTEATTTTTATAGGTPAIAIRWWGTTAGPANGPVTALLLGLNSDPNLPNLSANINPHTAFPTLVLAQRGNDGTLRKVDRLELDESTRLAAYDLELFDGAEARCEGILQCSLRDGFGDALIIKKINY